MDRLVRMTPEQLASPELATWREQETKHVSIIISMTIMIMMITIIIVINTITTFSRGILDIVMISNSNSSKSR